MFFILLKGIFSIHKIDRKEVEIVEGQGKSAKLSSYRNTGDSPNLLRKKGFEIKEMIYFFVEKNNSKNGKIG